MATQAEILAKTLKALRASGQFLPTLRRHREHLDECAAMGIEPEPFLKFAEEVLSTPEENRAWLLSPDEVPNYEPATHYAQYDMPRGEDLVFGTHRRKK